MAQKAPKIKNTESIWKGVTFPNHVEEAIKDAMIALEHFVPDAELRRLLISKPENRRVAKLGKDPEIAWILGFLRGITDTLQMEPEAVWR